MCNSSFTAIAPLFRTKKVAPPKATARPHTDMWYALGGDTVSSANWFMGLFHWYSHTPTDKIACEDLYARKMSNF